MFIISDKEIMFCQLRCFVCLSICLPFSNITQKIMMDCNEIFMEGSGVVKKKWLDFDGGSAHHAECPNGNPAITQ